MKRILRIGAVVIALTMLAGYVVYSQKGHNPGGQFTFETRGGLQTNDKPANAGMVAPGSKSMARVIAVSPPATTNTELSPEQERELIIASSSKSAQVFTADLTPLDGWYLFAGTTGVGPSLVNFNNALLSYTRSDAGGTTLWATGATGLPTNRSPNAQGTVRATKTNSAIRAKP